MDALTGDPVIDFLLVITGIGTGGLVIALIEWLRNSKIKEREIYIDISKTKIASVSKTLPYYGQIVGHSYELNHEVTKELLDCDLILYHICCILYFKDQCFRQYGPIQLDNVDAEYTIEKLGRGFEYILKEKIGTVEMSIMKILPRDYPHFHDFKAHITNNKDIVSNISSALESYEFTQQITKIIRYYRELITIEINDVYRTWYTEKTTIPLVSKDTQEYLVEHHQLYWGRLKFLAEEGRVVLA